LRPGISVDLDALHAFLAPLAEPSAVDSFKFSREWLRDEAARVTDVRASNISRKFNVPPSYVLIHRVSTAGIGVLCQLECEGEFRAEVIRWIPGYLDPEPAQLSANPCLSGCTHCRICPRGRCGYAMPRPCDALPCAPHAAPC